MSSGQVAAMLLAGQISVEPMTATDGVCELCGSVVLGVTVQSAVRADLGIKRFGFCRECAERVALGITSVLTGSAWGIPLSKEGRALLDAQQTVAETASDMLNAIDAITLHDGSVWETVRKSLRPALKRWREASDKFVASFTRQVRTLDDLQGAEAEVFAQVAGRVKRSGVDRRQAERRQPDDAP